MWEYVNYNADGRERGEWAPLAAEERIITMANEYQIRSPNMKRIAVVVRAYDYYLYLPGLPLSITCYDIPGKTKLKWRSELEKYQVPCDQIKEMFYSSVFWKKNL